MVRKVVLTAFALLGAAHPVVAADFTCAPPTVPDSELASIDLCTLGADASEELPARTEAVEIRSRDSAPAHSIAAELRSATSVDEPPRLIATPLPANQAPAPLLPVLEPRPAIYQGAGYNGTVGGVTREARLQQVSREGYSVDDFSRYLRLAKAADLGAAEDVLREGLPAGNPMRREIVKTALGDVVVRWSGTAKLGGGSDESGESIVQAWHAAHQVIERNGFPTNVGYSSIDWNLVLREGAPMLKRKSLVGSRFCQSAWMGPPADIVVDLARIVQPCNGAPPHGTAIARLRDSLVHEIAHAIEYHLLGAAFSYRERWHGEGFASWFETLAVEVLPKRDSSRADLRETLRARARSAFAARPKSSSPRVSAGVIGEHGTAKTTPGWSTALFDGSPDDYARSYALIATIAERFGPRALFQAYETAAADRIALREAIHRNLGLNEERWVELAREHISR